MAVALAPTRNARSLPRANVRDPANPFPGEQYVKVPNVAIFSEHETKTPQGDPQKFDQDALQRLIDRGNDRIAASGDYAAVCVGHTHDPDDSGAEQPEVIGAMGPYRLGFLGHPGTRQKYAILADLWIRRDKIDQYNAHPRRSVELWYERDKPAWIDPLSLLTEAPRLDLGLTPLIPSDAGTDGAELKYLYAASFGGLRRVKYAAGCASAESVFVPAHTTAPKHYAAGSGEPEANSPQTTKDSLMLAPEDIKQICDAIEQLDVITAMRDFMPMIPRIQEMLAQEGQQHAAMNAIPGEVPEAGAVAEPPVAPEPPTVPIAPEKPQEPPTPAEKPPEKLPEDLDKGKYSADEATDPKPKAINLDDMSEEDIERHLTDRRAKRSAGSGTADGKTTNQPGTGSVDAPVDPPKGSASGETQVEKAKYSALESRLAELEADRVGRADDARKEKLRMLRYHRAFDLEKEISRTTYAKMSDEQFKSHCEFIADAAAPTCANSPLPVPDELLDSKQPPASVRQRPERYSKENCEQAARVVFEQRQAGKEVVYETVLDNIVNGRPATA